MKRTAPQALAIGFGFCVLATAMLGWAPVAEAQFFWSPFFQEQPARPKVRPAKPKPPADDLPPILPKESSTPPPPDDRPYDAKLLRRPGRSALARSDEVDRQERRLDRGAPRQARQQLQ